MATIRLLLLFFTLLLLVAAAEDSNKCVYTIYVKTGSIIKGGTDSKISLTLGEESGRSVWVGDLKSWGLMEPSHEYFERGNLDVFSGRGPCMTEPVCRLNLTSDGSGSNHGWYCHYVEVASTRPHKRCNKVLFNVDQWLATDVPPFQLTALLDRCGSTPELSLAGRDEGMANA